MLVDDLVDLVSRSPGGMTKRELIEALRRIRPGLQAVQVEREVRAAIADGRLRFEGGRLSTTGPLRGPQPEPPASPNRPLRAVAFDIESVVRQTSEPPDFREARMFQLGAVRFGRDKAWCHEHRKFDEFVELPAEDWEIRSSSARERWEQRRRPTGQVLEDFRTFVADADVLVAYNGTGVDFPLLTETFKREGAPSLEHVRYIDGYYLALALWPTPPRQHRLTQIAGAVGAKATRLHWHDALDDSILLSLLLAVGARQLAHRPQELRELIASATADSDAWELLFDLAGLVPRRRALTDSDIATVLSAAMSGKPTRRQPGGTLRTATKPVHLPDSLLDANGNVSPFKLACAAGHQGEPRPAQQDMTDAMRDWITAGRPGLLEAPTGTGKSFAMLANALEWLARGADRKVVIATFTKQLQAQLAEDIERLAGGGLPILADAADLVKGKANRLSLRALVTALADCTTRDQDGRRRQPRRTPFAGDAAYQELVAYLALRLAAPATLTEEWEGRSVDEPDIPAFFDDYCARRLHLYLTSLSQAAVGEYTAAAGSIGLYTDDVAEAIANHRLIVANHALLLANLEDLASSGAETLLLIDEAHMLEDAATAAMTPVLDYTTVEQLPHDIERWLSNAPDHPALPQVADANRQLELFLDQESLPNVAQVCFDDGSGEVGTRTVAIATPRGGTVGLHHSVALVRTVGQLHRRLVSLLHELGAYERRGGLAGADRLDAERFWAAFTRVAAAEEAAKKIVNDAQAIIGPPPGQPYQQVSLETGPPDAAGSDAAASPAPQPTAAQDARDAASTIELLGEPDRLADGYETDTGLGLEDLSDAETSEADSDAAARLADDVEAADTGDVLPLGTVQRPIAPPAPNRVVWAEETGRSDLAGGARRYRFRLGSSPIALPDEDAWCRFLALVPCTYYISATLTVAGGWKYICNRLGLDPASTEMLTLDSPFDIGSQARLVCFEDFPSWAEQHDQAVRSVGWQLAGYARETMISGDGDETVGWSNGAMLLTTSKQATSDISLELERLLVDAPQPPPVYTTTLLGNARAVDNFKTAGGLLVGTRGLWQGVDINKPERLRLVWINKLPFAPFADPVIAARRALAAEQAEAAGAEDPDQTAAEDYYLPLAAIALRQAVGRLIRSTAHRGVVVISDRKLSGPTRLRQSYRRILLGSLDPDLLVDDPDTGEAGGGNVVPMALGWRRIWEFLVDPVRAAQLCTDEALDAHTLLPETREVLSLALSAKEEQLLRSQDADGFRAEVVRRCELVGGLLNGRREPIALRDKQIEAIEAVADGGDVLAVLPTGYGKSFAFQLPALVLPGVTVVVSPLVSLMQNQALDLNRTIGGAVRALVAPLGESNSRLGKAEVADALTGRESHGIRIVYLSPERLCTRQFQDLIRRGVEAGVVRRIAIDEAHTSVQWGDDFRPAFRRVEQFLTALRSDHPNLGITALTATANQTVREGLRTGLFGLPPEPAGAEPGFRFITANPMRPELALYRRTLGSGQGGPVTVAGLVEAVVAALDDHAIFYCLTVREVDALWAQLRDVLGADEASRVRRYHGRLTEAEKAAVVDDFVDAPRRGDDDFVPMIIVATSAFGLGIDRPDIRCVFVVSPPTDVAALYQQLGRAGRDCSGRPVEPNGPANIGLALGTSHSFNLVRWMTSQDLPAALFLRIAESILTLGTEPTVEEAVLVDTVELARTHIADDYAAGRLSEAQARSARTDDAYRLAVVRVIATLAGLDAIDDLGDFPDRIKILPGELIPADQQLAQIVATVNSVGVDRLRRIEVSALHQRLCDRVDGYDTLAPEPGATWSLLVDLHALGYLDVSQAPSRTMLTGVRLAAIPAGQSEKQRIVPARLAERMSGRARRAAGEVAALVDWYNDDACANAGIAKYFHVQVPQDVCSHGVCRCSSCWGLQRVAAAGEPLPRVLQAFRTPRPRPASTTAAGRPAFERNLDSHIESLLWDNRLGLTPGLIRLVLRGGDTVYDQRRNRRRTLWPNLLYSRHRGSAPGVAQREVDASLTRLAARGAAAKTGDRWRLQAHIDAAARQAMRQAGGQLPVAQPASAPPAAPPAGAVP